MENSKNKAYGWIMVVILCLGTAVLYYSNLIFAVRGLETMEKFSMNEGQLASISTIGCLPGAFLSIWIGSVLDRTNIKTFTLGALVLTVICMVLRIFTSNYIGLMITTVLIGTFLLPIIIVGPKMIGSLFTPD